MVRTLNQQQSNVLITDGKSEPQTADQTQVQQPSINEKATEQTCTKCGNNNPSGSKFCNSCGSPLSPACAKCGFPNPSGAAFCGQCGSKL